MKRILFSLLLCPLTMMAMQQAQQPVNSERETVTLITITPTIVDNKNQPIAPTKPLGNGTFKCGPYDITLHIDYANITSLHNISIQYAVTHNEQRVAGSTPITEMIGFKAIINDTHCLTLVTE